MAKILRVKDRVKVTIGEVEFLIAPLSRDAKRLLGECNSIDSGKQRLDLLKANSILLKYGVKEMKGVTDYAGEPYNLEFDGDILTDDCVDDLLNLQEKEKLCASAWSVVNGEIEDFELDGVALEVVPHRMSSS